MIITSVGVASAQPPSAVVTGAPGADHKEDFTGRKLSLSFGVGSVTLEDGLEGTSTHVALGVDRGGLFGLALEYQKLEFGDLRTDHRLGAKTERTFFVWGALRQYATMRAYGAYRSTVDGIHLSSSAFGVGAEIGMGVALKLIGPVEGFAEVGFGATAWQDPSQADQWEHHGMIMFGLRGRM
jgi:hypothetical protein